MAVVIQVKRYRDLPSMDWLTFLATIIGHLAWPSVVALLLYLLRAKLVELADRVEEITFPGGAKAKFVKALETGRVKADSLIAERPSLAENTLESLEAKSPIVNDYPEAAIIRAFAQIEQELIRARSAIDLAPRTNLPGIMRKLVQRGLIDAEAEALFNSLRQARNAAVHTPEEYRITPGEAFEFATQARFLSGLVSAAVDQLPSR